MAQPRRPSAGSILGSLALIAVVIGGAAVAFAYTAGWFSPQRLTPDKLVDAFTPATGEPLGHRKNHAKGICFTGTFEANGAGSALSDAQVFSRGQFPVLGRFNLGTAREHAPTELAVAHTSVSGVHQGRAQLYRARWTGLSREAAVQACQRLAHGRTSCMVVSPESQL